MKLKIKDLFDLLEVINDGNTGFFGSLNVCIRNTLEDIYKIDSEIYDESTLKQILSDDYGLCIDFLEHSNDKFISPFYNKLYDLYKNEDIDENTLNQLLAEMISEKYAFKWWKISNAITTNYKPLENYDLNEVRTPDLTENITRKTKTDMNVHQDSESGIYGFNSTESQPTATGTGDTHTTGLNTNNQTDDYKTNTGTETLTRHGNIGVTTSQQMLESEIKLRQYDFIEEVYNDIDSILCLKIY